MMKFANRTWPSRHDLCVVAALVGGSGIVHGVSAQDTPARSEQATGQGRSGAAVLEELVVTARRREENLQDVPISVTALSQEALRENGIHTFNDLQHLVPSMTLATGASRNEQWVSIRGISGLATDGQAVVTYLNEVPLGPSANGGTGGSGPGLFFDLDTVQVLKGPQGTLFGRNALGGAILYQTKRPTEQFEGYLEGTYGNYNNRELQGALNLPISDQLRVRIAVNSLEREGFTKSLGTGNHPGGVDLDDRSVFAARGTISFNANDAFENDLIYSYVDSRDHGPSNILTFVDTTGAFVDPAGSAYTSYPGLTDTLEQQQRLGIRTQVAIDAPQWSFSKMHSLANLSRLELSDVWTFRNIASFSKMEVQNVLDTDGSPFPISGSAGAGSFTPLLATPFVVKTITEEAQLQGSLLDGKLTTTVGGYFESRPGEVTRYHSVVFGSERVRERIGYNNTDNENRAVYGQASYDLSEWIDGLKLTAGYRYSWDSQFQQLRRLDTNGDCTSPSPGFDENCAATGGVKQSGPNWTIGLDYQLSPDTLVYIVGRHGYHQGGVNLGVSGASVATYAPEYATDVEIGAKTEWRIADLQGRTNIAFYRLGYTDVQTFEQKPDDTGALVAVFGNASEARTWGAELDATLVLTQSLELGVQFDWLDFKYTKFGPGVDSAQLERETLQNRPRFKYGFSSRYYLPIAESLGEMSVMARWAWQDETVIAAFLAGASPSMSERAYGLLSLGGYWDHVGGSSIDAMVYVNNALDKAYKTGGYINAAAYGVDSVTYGEPRMYGVRLRYRFD